jgi:hypothetical protein
VLPIRLSIEPLRSINSAIDGIVGIAVKLTAGQFASGPPLPLPVPSSTQVPSAVHT